MIANGAQVRVFVQVEPCDMRKQINGLSAQVRAAMERDPQSGDLYLFRNRRGDMLKLLFFDRGGYCLLMKRLECGTFQFPLSEDGETVEISQQELSWLLANAELVRKIERAA